MSRNDRADNFTRRLRETMDSELEPELISPVTAGYEELPEYESKFPLVSTFKQTNMRSSGGRKGSQSQRGRDSD